MLNITKKTSTTNTTSLPNRSIKYIVIHYTAGVTSKAGTAASTASYFSNASVKASADFIVDDGTIVQFNPDIANRYAWHCGGSKYATKGGSLYGVATLKNTIGIEICSTNKTGKMTYANDSNYYFKDTALNNAVDLVKYLMDKYNIDVNHVIRHYDVNGKQCPGIVGWNADTGDESQWLAFKKRLTTTTTTSSNTTTNQTKSQKEEEIVTQEDFNKMMDVYLKSLAEKDPSSWSSADRTWAESNNLITGSDGKMQYKKFLTREEFAAVLHRYYEKFK